MRYQNILSAPFSFVTIHASHRPTDRQCDSNTVRCIRYRRTVKTTESWNQYWQRRWWRRWWWELWTHDTTCTTCAAASAPDRWPLYRHLSRTPSLATLTAPRTTIERQIKHSVTPHCMHVQRATSLRTASLRNRRRLTALPNQALHRQPSAS